MSSVRGSSSDDQKARSSDKEIVASDAVVSEVSLFKLAELGQPCTDEHGRPIVALNVQEETHLRRKIDSRLLPVISLMYCLCFLDRANVGNARIAGMEKSLGMTHLDYNFMIMSFYIVYAAAELPLLYLTKRIGPAKVLPVCVFGFGIITICFAFVNNTSQAIVVRCFLAVAEAPMIPGLAYYLSRFYRRTELAFRIAAFIAAAPLAGGVGGLICSAILKSPSIGSLRQWRMIFLVEGLVTAIVGLLALLALPQSIETARWLSPHERALGLVRIKSENVASQDVVDAIRRKMIKRGMFAWTPILIGLSHCVVSLSSQSIGYMLPSIIKIIYPHYTTPMQQLMTTPPYLLSALMTLIIAFTVTKIRQFTLLSLAVFAVGVLGYALSAAYDVHHPHLRYDAIFLIAMFAFACGPLGISWTLCNNNTDSERAAAISIYIFIGYITNISSAFVYAPSDAPNYHQANTAVAVLCAASFVITIVCGYLLRRENERRERGDRDYQLRGLSLEQQETLGRHHPAFRYQY